MSVAGTELESQFALDIVAGALEGFVPPDSPFEPHGDWDLSYRVCTLTRGCDQVGRLGLRRRARGRKRHTLYVDYEKTMPGGYRQNVRAELDCQSDGLGTPVGWEFGSEIADKDGKVLPGLSLNHRARRVRRGVRLRGPGTDRVIPFSPPYTVNWALFEAVQRLRGESFEPISFTMLDHFDEVKRGQRLSYRNCIETVLGWDRVREEHVEELAEGRITRTRWAREGGRPVRLHAYDHVGEGIVPWVYWVDGQGRLLFVVAGLEAYLLDNWAPERPAGEE